MAERDAPKLHRSDAGVCYAHVRLDCWRDTSFLVTRNVGGHIHITVGKSDATLILHPHAAKRLVAGIQAVLEGEEYTKP